jgi:predicted glycosyl hydrolase (DUF1957 family)
MIWLNFLHIYQPANSAPKEILEASKRSYWRIVRALEKNSDIKFTINISGCLFLAWKELGCHDLINRFVSLIKKGQLEITGTAAYHPFMPRISRKEMMEQIKENEEILKEFLGRDFKAKGFFIPEMAYHPNISKTVKKAGYEWIILDEIAYNGKIGIADISKAYLDKRSGLKIIFRSRKFSTGYFPDKFKEALDKQIVITATDGELYGLRHMDPKGNFEKMLERKDIKTMTISQYLKDKEVSEIIRPLNCSWESNEEELKDNNPYFLWHNPKNKIHMQIWKFADSVNKILDKYKNDENYAWARWHLVRGLASCAFWWASEKDFRHVFGPQAWNPDEIEKRVDELVRAVRSLEKSTSFETKIKIENQALEIKKNLWEKHWKMQAKK